MDVCIYVSQRKSKNIEQAPSSLICHSLTYTSTMPSNFVLRIIMDCLTTVKFQPFCHFQLNQTKTAGGLQG